jgi:hypothetical protein
MALCTRATLRFGRGDFSGFLADVRAAKRMGRLMTQGESFIERYVGYAIEQCGDGAIAAAADGGKLTGDQCAAIRKMESELPERGGLLVTVDEAERYQKLEMVTQLAVDKVKIQTFHDQWGDFQKTIHTIDRSAIDWDEVLRQFNAEYDRNCNVIAAPNVAEERDLAAKVEAQLNEWESEFAKPTDLSRLPGEDRKAYADRVARRLMAQLVSPVDGARELQERARLSDEMAMTLVALADMKARTGQWPETLKELVPAELKELPRDIYSAGGKGTDPVKYGMTANGPLIYSLGPGGRNVAGTLAGDSLGGFAPEPPVVNDATMP